MAHGKSASESVQGTAEDGALNLDHVVASNTEVTEAGVADGRVSPMLVSRTNASAIAGSPPTTGKLQVVGSPYRSRVVATAGHRSR